MEIAFCSRKTDCLIRRSNVDHSVLTLTFSLYPLTFSLYPLTFILYPLIVYPQPVIQRRYLVLFQVSGGGTLYRITSVEKHVL